MLRIGSRRRNEHSYRPQTSRTRCAKRAERRDGSRYSIAPRLDRNPLIVVLSNHGYGLFLKFWVLEQTDKPNLLYIVYGSRRPTNIRRVICTISQDSI